MMGFSDDDDDLPSPPPPPLWHSPMHTPRPASIASSSRHQDLRSASLLSTPKSVVCKYTSSLASLPTPTNAIRVTSVKRVSYSAKTATLPVSEPGTLYYAMTPMSTPKRTFKDRRMFASSTPVPSIARNSELDESFGSYETTHEYLARGNANKALGRLHRKIETEVERVYDAKRMILTAKKSAGPRYSMRELCAHALLVISKSRLQMYKELASRIETYALLNSTPNGTSKYVRSRITIKGIQLHLTRSYFLKTMRDDAPYAFMIVASTHDKVIASEVLLANETDGIRDQKIDIEDSMSFMRLPLNFQVRIEIFAMKLEKRVASSPKEFAKKAMSIFGHCTSPITAEEVERSTTGFYPVGYAYITRDNAINNGTRSLLVSQNLFPIDGVMDVTFDCTPLPPELYVAHKGVWSLFCGTGDTSYWVKMIHGVIRFYDCHHRDDDPAEEPRFIIDMSYISNRKVEHDANGDHKWAFAIDVLSFPRDSEYCEQKRYLIGVDTELMMKSWLERINACLNLIRNNL